MNRFVALLQLMLALLLVVVVIVTAHNLVNLAFRPETVSVANVLVGQGLLIVCLAALATLLFRAAWRRLKAPGQSSHR